MKIRKDFLLAVFVLFAIPAIGYFVLERAADDRNKITARLQPKDSLAQNLSLDYLTAEGNQKTVRLIDMPYVLKVISTREGIIDFKQLEEILYIINDRSDFVFLVYETSLSNTITNRIAGYHFDDGHTDLSKLGDVLLVDAYNRIYQVYDSQDEELYKKILEDISYAFPMIDYRIEKMKKRADTGGE